MIAGRLKAFLDCFLQTAPNGSLQELQQVTGSLGFAWNQCSPFITP
jgi:hypothetical protein